jgi:hypothetical protein
MAYIYLLDLYKKIDLHLTEIMVLLTDEQQTPDQIRFLKGRRDVLIEFKEFLKNNLDEKLPKRIRKQLSKTDE